MEHFLTENKRIIVHLSTHTDEPEIKKYLEKFSYFLNVPISKNTYLDMTGISPQDPPHPRPLDTIPDRSQDFLKGMSSQIYIPSDKNGVLAVLIRNDPRRPGMKKYHTIIVFCTDKKKIMENKITELQQFLKSKGK